MNNQLNRVLLGEGLAFSAVQDPKFKHNHMTINLILPLAEETATDYALLPFLLRKGTQECPDFTRLNARLNELYGAGLSGDVSKFGGNQVLEISIVGMDDRFTLEGEELISQCAQLLAQVVCTPNIVNNAFPAQDVELEKQFLEDTILAEINDKRSYAMNQCRSMMCKGQPTGVKKYGSVERLATITPQSAAASYQKVMDEAWIEILFVGSGNPQKAMDIFKGYFAPLARHPKMVTRLPIQAVAKQVTQQVEKMEVSQSKLVMGFRAGALESGEERIAARLMTALYGGTPFSKLFINVREKMSLCYYCAARLDRITGILMVDCGIEAQNNEKAQGEILRQLALLQQGEFTEEDLESAKMTVIGSLRSVTDSLGSIEDWYLAQIMQGKQDTPTQEAEEIQAVTKEQLIAAAQAVSLDTVYLLTSKEAIK